MVFGGALTKAKRMALAESDERLVVEASRLSRALPKPKAPRKAPEPRVRRSTGDRARVWKLLSVRDRDGIRQGLELLTALAEPEIFDELLAEVTHDASGTLVRGARFTGTGSSQPFLDTALLGVLAMVTCPHSSDHELLEGELPAVV